MSDRLLNVLTGVTVALALFVVARPGGAAQRVWASWVGRNQSIRELASVRQTLFEVGQVFVQSDSGRLLVEFSDYQCPYCRSTESEVRALLRQEPDVTLLYMHLPLPSHPVARVASTAVICAEGEGLAQTIHDSLMHTEAWQDATNWLHVVSGWGVKDTASFAACLRSPDVEARLNRSIAIAESLGVQGTPTFLGRKGRHVGGADRATLRALTE